MSCPTPLPTVLIPVESESKHTIVGFSLVVPPNAKRSSLRYSFIPGPSVSEIIFADEPPTTILSKYPAPSSTPFSA